MLNKEPLLLLLWTENLSVHVDRFDSDHKRLVRLINELHSMASDAAPSGQLDAVEFGLVLARLQNYFHFHCLSEEEVMEQTSYPGLEDHRLAHTRYFNAVNAMVALFEGSNRVDDAVEMMNFIYGYVVDHINTLDKEYSEHLRKCGID